MTMIALLSEVAAFIARPQSLQIGAHEVLTDGVLMVLNPSGGAVLAAVAGADVAEVDLAVPTEQAVFAPSAARLPDQRGAGQWQTRCRCPQCRCDRIGAAAAVLCGLARQDRRADHPGEHPRPAVLCPQRTAGCLWSDLPVELSPVDGDVENGPDPGGGQYGGVDAVRGNPAVGAGSGRSGVAGGPSAPGC